MAVFVLSHDVVLIRGFGTSQEQRREQVAGGLLDTEALFYVEARVKRGDVIECEALDEPRIVTAVHPQMTMDGVSHYKASLEPLSAWQERQRMMNGHPIYQTVHGNVGNMAAVSGSTHVSMTQSSNPTIEEVNALVDRMTRLVQENSGVNPETKADYRSMRRSSRANLDAPRRMAPESGR